MRFMAGLAVAASFAVIAASTADAQTRQRTTTQRSVAAPSTVFVSRDERGRTRTRIIVQKRSYLDGGTEVMPGDRPASNAMIFPTHNPTHILGRNDATNPPGPLFDPWWLSGKNNPWPWNPF
jgi:hypothetical protein